MAHRSNHPSHLPDVTPALLWREQEVEDRPVVPHVDGVVRQIECQHVAHQPPHRVRIPPESFLPCGYRIGCYVEHSDIRVVKRNQ